MLTRMARLVGLTHLLRPAAPIPDHAIAFRALSPPTRAIIVMLAAGNAIVFGAVIIHAFDGTSLHHPATAVLGTLALLAINATVLQWGVVQKRASPHRVVFSVSNAIPLCALFLVPLPCAMLVAIVPELFVDFRDHCPPYVIAFNASIMGLVTGVLAIVWTYSGYAPDRLLSHTPTDGMVIALLILVLAHHLLTWLLTYSGISWARGSSFIIPYRDDIFGPRLRYDLSMSGIAIGATFAIVISPAFFPLVLAALYAIRVAIGDAGVRDAAERDHLTGLANRATFSARLDIEVAQARRHKTPLTLIFIDLDHFKQINDAYGHKTGDKALQAVAQTTEKMARTGDLAARLAGDEFVVLLPHTDTTGGHIFAYRLSCTLNNLIVREHNASIGLACSMGLASYRTPETGDDLLHRADQANYLAKRGGGGRVGVAQTLNDA